MSDFSADTTENLNFRDILARIDRQQAETRKFAAEQTKLAAEAAKFSRERFLAPLTLAVTSIGAGAALFAAAQAFLRSGGHS